MTLKQSSLIAGCDEVGRGAGAADIYIGCVILDPAKPIAGLRDSKKLSATRREQLSEEIKEKALAWSIATANLDEIIEHNVLGATLLAMSKAVAQLSVTPELVYVDGNKAPQLTVPVETIIKGDDKVPAISAASIIAKVARDQKMVEWHDHYPEYGFDKHKGYLTQLHLQALESHGPCPIHRVTYEPIRRVLLERKAKSDQLGMF
ncbi:ribonuclease HII [Halioxenophilus sp. WMMB6]|uniref:ribonuclease HII n=1 Tax=Halioxenophilus sp. WMMB6 TaxID=3073815 RepID=UPI00295EF67C|nr:ribonuclease HII [Halioxenophilus sp. WMMB6]